MSGTFLCPTSLFINLNFYDTRLKYLIMMNQPPLRCAQTYQKTVHKSQWPWGKLWDDAIGKIQKLNCLISDSSLRLKWGESNILNQYQESPRYSLICPRRVQRGQRSWRPYQEVMVQVTKNCPGKSHCHRALLLFGNSIADRRRDIAHWQSTPRNELG